MKVTLSMIHPELRGIAKLLKPLSASTNTAMCKAALPFYDCLAHCRNRNLDYRSIYVPRKGILSEKDSSPSWMRMAVYAPKEPKDIHGICLWLHGGGFAMGYPEENNRLISELVSRHGFLVYSPAYRLSVEAPYPAALNDALEAWRYILRHQAVRSDLPLILGGESAGGSLAIALSLLLRDSAVQPADLLLPLYPMLDDRMNTPSMIDNDAPVWNAAKNKAAWNLYLSDLDPNQIPVYAAPGRENNLSDLPPMISYIGDIDPFYDENRLFFDGLRAAGGTCRTLVCRGCFHGFDLLFPYVHPAKRARFFLHGQIRELLGKSQRSNAKTKDAMSPSVHQ